MRGELDVGGAIDADRSLGWVACAPFEMVGLKEALAGSGEGETETEWFC